MKKSRLLTLLLPVLLFCWILSASACADKHYRKRHAGYDSQQWMPRKHKNVPMRTQTGTPRERSRK